MNADQARTMAERGKTMHAKREQRQRLDDQARTRRRVTTEKRFNRTHRLKEIEKEIIEACAHGRTSLNQSSNAGAEGDHEICEHLIAILRRKGFEVSNPVYGQYDTDMGDSAAPCPATIKSYSWTISWKKK